MIIIITLNTPELLDSLKFDVHQSDKFLIVLQSYQVDSARRNVPELFSTSVVGPFLLSGVAATLAWWVVWPLEYMKSQVQQMYILVLGNDH